jgi:FtsZ-binding cell division protein ZapB
MNEQDKKAFGKWFENNWQDSDDKDVFTEAWQAACLYKQKEIDELKLQYDKLTDWASEYVAENARLNQEIEKFKGYLEAWGKDE